MPEPITTAIEQLRKDEQRLSEKTITFRRQLHDAEDALNKIQAALQALGEKPATKAAKSKPRKPAATKQAVIATIVEVLSDNTVVEREALKKQVESKLIATGKNRHGFALRFSEAIKDSRFIDSPGGYRLAEEEPAEPLQEQMATPTG